MTGRTSVLYVGEDAAGEALAEAGAFRLDTAAPGAAAERVREGAHDCLVLGESLDAETVLDAADAHAADLPLLVFSTEPVAEEAIERGADGYVRAAGPERWTVLASRVGSELERVCAERRGEERVRQVYERTTESIVAVDPDFRVSYANEQAASFFGYEPERLVGMHFFDDFPDSPSAPFEREYRRAMETQEPTTFVAESNFDPGTWLEVRAYPSESGLSIYFRDVTERRRREKELETYEAIVDAAPDGIYVLDSERRFDILNRAAAEMGATTREVLLGEPIDVLAEKGIATEESIEKGLRHIDALEAGERVRFEDTVLTPEGERTVENNLASLGDGSVVNVVRDVTDRKEDRQALARQRDELETLNRINGVIRTAIGSLVEESDREGIEQAVCRGLVESELYRCVWVGRTNDGGSAVTVEAAMGEWAATDGPISGSITEGPAIRAIEEDAVQYIEDFGDLSPRVEESTPPGLVVPISRGSAVDAVLTIGADRDGAFTPSEREALAVLGEVVGFALTAVRHQELLFADRVTELTFDAHDSRSVFVRAACEHDCRIERRGFVPVNDGGLHYAAVSGSPPAAILDSLLADDSFDDGRVVSADGETGVIELQHTGSSVVLLLTEHGARVREAVSSPEETTVVADVPPGADVRGVVDAVQASFPAVELVGKHRRERPATAGSKFAEAAADELTERQRSALRAAYLAGYYDWPRDSTAEEVADSMDISSATLHQHLRAAESKLLSSLFDTDT